MPISTCLHFSSCTLLVFLQVLSIRTAKGTLIQHFGGCLVLAWVELHMFQSCRYPTVGSAIRGCQVFFWQLPSLNSLLYLFVSPHPCCVLCKATKLRWRSHQPGSQNLSCYWEVKGDSQANGRDFDVSGPFLEKETWDPTMRKGTGPSRPALLLSVKIHLGSEFSFIEESSSEGRRRDISLALHTGELHRVPHPAELHEAWQDSGKQGKW